MEHGGQGANVPKGRTADGGCARGEARTYLCIDLKSFYASVECADRGLDPFSTDLVVADPERSANTICLAITPALKAKGVRNRCRVREIPVGLPYLTAVPRMRRYMEVSAEIYRIYLRFVAQEDIHVYSVDECFIDATPYLGRYQLGARAFARKLMGAVRDQTGIAATAGIGPNLFLCKVALDICAKHADDGIGMLDGATFMRDIWFHHPLTDIWGIGHGIARRLAERRIYDLAGICAEDPTVLRRLFGKNAEPLIDHAWGLEPATIADIRGYVPRARSLSNGQVLMRDYSFDEARTIVREMAFGSALDLAEKGCACGSVGLYVGYSRGMLARPEDLMAEGVAALHGGGERRLRQPTASEREIARVLLALYDGTVSRRAQIRRVCIALGEVVPAGTGQLSLFGDAAALARDEEVARAAVRVRRRFGPNALLRGTSLRPEANARERNRQIGGHRA